MKIFCIGFNKTGTKTLHCWLEWVGIKSTHNVEWPQRTRELSDEQLMKYLAPHDAYSDGEMADFRRLSRLYPESIFLLNTRSMKSWLESRVKHVFRPGGIRLIGDNDSFLTKWSSRLYHFRRARSGQLGAMAVEFLNGERRALARWIENREAYHRDVLEFFSVEGLEKLLVINVCEDKNWQDKLRRFLGLDATVDTGKRIHKNMSNSAIDEEQLKGKFALIERVLSEKDIVPERWNDDCLCRDSTSWPGRGLR